MKTVTNLKICLISEIYLNHCGEDVLTLRRCSFPPELRVHTRKCFVKRKHCLSPSFFREREPRRTLLSFPRSTDGSWIREPEEHDRKRITLNATMLTLSWGLCLLSKHTCVKSSIAEHFCAHAHVYLVCEHLANMENIEKMEDIITLGRFSGKNCFKE